MTTFDDTFKTAYGFDVPSIEIGHVLRDGSATGELPVRVPLRMMNRHGMIAGSTGTGKTRTLQLFAEGLSRAGVPVFLADVKGDLAGMCIAGAAGEPLQARAAAVGRTHAPEAFPVEFFSLTGKRGTQLRATVSASPLAAKYATPMNRESAHEMLQKRLEQNVVEEQEESAQSYEADDGFAWRKGGSRPAARRRTSSPRPRKTAVEKAVNRR